MTKRQADFAPCHPITSHLVVPSGLRVLARNAIMHAEEKMPWRKWNIIIVLVLANYVVFGLIAAFVFPVRPQAPLIHTVQPTFTPGTPAPQRVGTLSYDFLTPSPSVRATSTSTRTPTAPPSTTAQGTTPTEATTTSATSAATIASTPAPTTASTPPPTLPPATSTSSAPTGTATASALLAPRPLVTATSTPRP